MVCMIYQHKFIFKTPIRSAKKKTKQQENIAKNNEFMQLNLNSKWEYVPVFFFFLFYLYLLFYYIFNQKNKKKIQLR